MPIVKIPYGGRGRVDANYIDLYVLSFAEDGTVAVPNAALSNELRTYFTKYQEINTEVTVRRGFLLRVDITGNVYLDPAADVIQVKAKVNDAVKGLFRADVRELGEPFYISKLLDLLFSVGPFNI